MRIKGAFGLLFLWGQALYGYTRKYLFCFFTARTVDEECYFFHLCTIKFQEPYFECLHLNRISCLRLSDFM